MGKTITDINRELAELLGLKFDWIGCVNFGGGACSDYGEVSGSFCDTCKDKNHWTSPPTPAR
jgi:hypothetical protein